ncbi:MAG: universal stress protein [Acidobacteriota bacterium]
MKRILVALDSSPRAELVLSTAARLAATTGAKLVLFRAITLPELPNEVFAMPQARVEDILRAEAHAQLDKLAAAVDRALIERITTELATPWDGITREAKKVDADLIVIGSHGYGRLDRLLGTTAAKVVNHADRNVLIVRTPL